MGLKIFLIEGKITAVGLKFSKINVLVKKILYYIFK